MEGADNILLGKTVRLLSQNKDLLKATKSFMAENNLEATKTTEAGVDMLRTLKRLHPALGEAIALLCTGLLQKKTRGHPDQSEGHRSAHGREHLQSPILRMHWACDRFC